MADSPPLVTVVMATYNWSSVLRYSIQSVLWQTFTDFELLVVGDGCTDDSAQVVASFADPRVHWHNLPQNTGDQAGPNNYGIEQSRGRYIAYLGHDDIWFPDHLHHMVKTIQSARADFAHAIVESISGPPDYKRHLIGVGDWHGTRDKYFLLPSGVMHRREIWDEIGPWRTGKIMILQCDLDFFLRAYQAGKCFVSTGNLTVLKPETSSRPNAYQKKSTHEQAAFVQHILEDPDFRYRELLATVNSLAQSRMLQLPRVGLDLSLKPGERFNQRLSRIGLETKILEDIPSTRPLYNDIALLQLGNEAIDITPLWSRKMLLEEQQLPVDGLLLAEGWRTVQQNNWGECFRPVLNNARFVVTNPTGEFTQIEIEVVPDAGVGGGTFRLQLLDESRNVMKTVLIDGREIVIFDLPLVANKTAMFQLFTPDGVDDYSANNFMIFSLRWHRGETGSDPHEASLLRLQLKRQQHELNEMIVFRSTSARYWIRRFRQWLRGYRD